MTLADKSTRIWLSAKDCSDHTIDLKQLCGRKLKQCWAISWLSLGLEVPSEERKVEWLLKCSDSPDSKGSGRLETRSLTARQFLMRYINKTIKIWWRVSQVRGKISGWCFKTYSLNKIRKVKKSNSSRTVFSIKTSKFSNSSTIWTNRLATMAMNNRKSVKLSNLNLKTNCSLSNKDPKTK